MADTVVFFGSGPVAAQSLRLLLDHTDVEAVITKPTTAQEMAIAAPGVPQYLVSTRGELDNLIQSHDFKSHAGVLIDFGIIVSQYVIDSFGLGIINSHFSLLPELRGADPITFSILSGQELTGVSLMLLVQKMDEGPLLAWGEQPLNGVETTPQLTEDLIALSDGLLQAQLPAYLAGHVVLFDQEIIAQKYHKSVSYSRKLSKTDGILDWSKPAQQLEREIRAFAGWPKSRTTLASKDVVISSARVAARTGQPGEVIVEGKELFICCGHDALNIITLKPAGKSEMPATAFLAGYRSLLPK